MNDHFLRESIEEILMGIFKVPVVNSSEVVITNFLGAEQGRSVPSPVITIFAIY